MGCSNSRTSSVMSRRMSVASRKPFNKAQIAEIRAIWEKVKRKFEETAKEMLIR